MNARQKAKTEMYQGVEQVCDENSAILGEVVAFQNAINNFKGLLAQILETEQSRSVPITGITADKVADRANLCRLASNLAGYISAYASVTRNETLKAEVSYTHSKFLQMREDHLLAATQNVHDLGIAHKTELKDYGVTDQKLEELQTAIETFKTSMTKPRAAKGQKSTLTANRNGLFDQIDDILTNQMDFLVQNYETDHHNFVANYQNARKIYDPATTKTQLKGIVTNKADGLPVKGATVTVVELEISTQTNSKGEYSLKPIEQGEFTIKTIATGFQNFVKDEFKIKLGEVNRLNAGLVVNI